MLFEGAYLQRAVQGQIPTASNVPSHSASLVLLLHENGLEKVLQGLCSSLCTEGLAPGKGGDTAAPAVQQLAPAPAAGGENNPKGETERGTWS